jgi:hypothetical protein
MGMIEDTVREIQEQTKACGSDGSAFFEWLSARDLDHDEFMEITQKEAEGLQQAIIIDPLSLSLVGMIQAAFRWGYETAIKKERENIL